MTGSEVRTNASVAVAVTGYVPALVGLPVIRPALSADKPGGRPVTTQVTGATPVPSASFSCSGRGVTAGVLVSPTTDARVPGSWTSGAGGAVWFRVNTGSAAVLTRVEVR